MRESKEFLKMDFNEIDMSRIDEELDQWINELEKCRDKLAVMEENLNLMII